MDSDSMGTLGFWIFIAAVVVAGIWSDARKKAEKHETLRRIVEKTGTIDEAKLNELFRTEAPPVQKPGSGYRALRVGGAIVMSIGAAMLVFFSIAAVVLSPMETQVPAPNKAGMVAAFAVSAGVIVLGLGIFLSSRFAEPPPGTRNEPPVT